METFNIELERTSIDSEFTIKPQELYTSTKIGIATLRNVDVAINSKFKQLKKFALTVEMQIQPYCYYNSYSLIQDYHATIIAVYDYDRNNLLEDMELKPIQV